jgi:hypothetical protein
MPYEVYSDQGIWLFKSTDKLNLDLDAIIRNAMKGSVAGNRKERRALESQSRRGLRLYSSETAREIARKFPVNDPQELVDIFIRRLSRRITDAAVEKKLTEILLRPTQIIRFTFEMDELRTRCPDVVVSIGERVVLAIADLRARLVEISDSVKNDFSRYVPAALLRRPALEAAFRGRRHIRGLRISDEQIGEIVHDAPYGAFKAVDLISRATQIYAAQHASDPRKTRYSDGADLLHLTYLPYCDVFRADVYTADVLRQCDPLATAKVARRLEDLSALIERCLAASPGPTTAPGTSRASEATGSGIRVGPSVS